MRCLAILLLVALPLPACQGARVKGAWENEPGAVLPETAAPGSAPATTLPAANRDLAPRTQVDVSDRPLQQFLFPGPRAARPRRGKVNLRPGDLAGIDQWLSRKKGQWVLGDVVDIYASKEYFSTILTLNAKVGMVQRKDEIIAGDHIVTMRYIGSKATASAMTNPRVQIGGDLTVSGRDVTGLTITARKVLRVRLARTTTAARPAQLRIVAHGDAAQGRGDDTLRRAERIELGGTLGYRRDCWVWAPYSR